MSGIEASLANTGSDCQAVAVVKVSLSLKIFKSGRDSYGEDVSLSPPKPKKLSGATTYKTRLDKGVFFYYFEYRKQYNRYSYHLIVVTGPGNR